VNPLTTVIAGVTPTSTVPHGPLAQFLLHPNATLHDLAHLVARGVILFAEDYLPILIGVAVIALAAKAAFVRWHSRRGAASASHLEILPPPTVDPHGAEVFWANVHALLQPSWLTRLRGRPQLVFEVRSTGQRVHFDLWAPIPTTAHIGRAAAAAWPGATVLPSESGAPLVGAHICAGRQLRLARSSWLPIATDHVLDPLRSVLAAATELSQDESAVIQVVARPASRRCLGKAQRGLLNMQGIPTPSPLLRVVGPLIHGLLDLVTPGPATPAQPRQRPTPVHRPELPAAREKLGRPCFEASVRVAVSSSHTDRWTARRLRSQTRAVCASFGSYAAENHFVSRRLPRPAATVCSRRTSRCDLYSVPELAALAHLPLDRDVPGLARAGAKRVSPPPEVGREGRILGDADAGPGRPIALAPRDAAYHMHVMGATGSGKSTLLLNMVLDDVGAGRGTVVVDPKGALVEDILDRLPDGAEERTVVIDAEDPEPPALNVLGGSDVHLTVDQVVGVMHRLFESAWGPRTDDVLRAACLTLRLHPGANLAQIPKLLTDPLYRAPLAAGIQDPVLRSFWRWYDSLSESARSAVIGPVTNKLRAFLLRPFVRAVVGTGTSSFSLDEILDGGVLLCRLPKGVLGDETVRLLGSLLVAQVWQAATTRARGGRWGRPCGLYLDEAHNFLAMPGSLEDVLAEARAYGLGLVLAHQHLEQLPADLAEAVSANARTKVFFRCSTKDAHRLQHDVAPDLSEHDLSHLGLFQAAARLVVNGEESAAFTFRTRPPGEVVSGRAALVRTWSRDRFGLSEQERRSRELKVEGQWGGRSQAGSPDDASDGFKLPGLAGRDDAGDVGGDAA
jgi:hypothetical protein